TQGQRPWENLYTQGHLVWVIHTHKVISCGDIHTHFMITSTDTLHMRVSVRKKERHTCKPGHETGSNAEGENTRKDQIFLLSSKVCGDNTTTHTHTLLMWVNPVFLNDRIGEVCVCRCVRAWVRVRVCVCVCDSLVSSLFYSYFPCLVLYLPHALLLRL